MTRRADESGFSLIEVLVAIGIFAVISTAFYQVLFAGAGGSTTARSVAEVSSEARLGLNRMIRDTRQAANITSATPTSYTIDVDFDGSGSITQAPTRNSGGDYEQLSFVFDDGQIYIEACNAQQGADCGEQKTILIERVGLVGTLPIFSYSTNHLEFDYNNNGIATQSELDSAGTAGITLSTAEKNAYLSDVQYSMNITDGDRTTTFYGHSQLRNKR